MADAGDDIQPMLVSHCAWLSPRESIWTTMQYMPIPVLCTNQLFTSDILVV